jgi:hypothetical protein
MTLPHRLNRGAFSGLLVALGLLSLCCLGADRPAAPYASARRSVSRALASHAKPLSPAEVDRLMRGEGRPRLRSLGPRKPIIGSQLPEWVKTAYDRPQQGSGPEPDKQLTPTAQSSQEYDAGTPRLEKTARVAFVSNGVDEWVNEFEPAPGGPPPAPNDPNHVPDGKIDRYGLSANGFNIWLMRDDGSQQIRITDMSGDEREPAYDPGGTVLAFVNDQTGLFQIYTVDILTKTIRQITTGSGNKHNPTWSADGTQLAYDVDLGGRTDRDIYQTATRGTGTPTPLAATAGIDEFQPTFSPQGLQILYTRQDGTVTHIWRMDSQGGNQEQMTNGGGDPAANDRDPAYRQDGAGTMFAFASDRFVDVTDQKRDFNIWTVGATGEVAGTGIPVLRSNTDPLDTADDIMPAFTPLLAPIPPVDGSRSPTRLVYTSLRMDAVGPPTGTAEPDIWATILADDRPPMLWELPEVSNRNPAPGSDVVVRCRPYDDETGIRTVRAFFKDPDCAEDDARGIDHKLYYFVYVNFEPNSFPGIAAIEADCERIGSTQLFDDGDMANDGDAVAGDGIFSGIWTTPNVPSDFIIDLELTDNSGNFINFDDVYGLSTVAFAPRSDVLLVDDYCEGQDFLSVTGFNNDWAFAYPCESYFTTNPGGAFDIYNISFNSVRDGIDGYGTDGEAYDLWRVICRGAPDPQTLTYYGPTAETQLTTDLSGIREVPVANRAIFWASPHSGDVWAAPGTITDAATQALLSQFVSRGGRLAMAGQDIAYALTLNGLTQNPFLTNVLGAQFVADDNTGRDIAPGIVPSWSIIARPPPPPELLADDPWSPLTHYGDYLTTENDGGPEPDDDTTDDMDHIHPAREGDDPDAHWFSPYPDVIAASGSEVTYTYDEGVAPYVGMPAAVKRIDATTGARVAYFAFPFESIDRHYHTTGNPAVPHCRNKRSKLAHVTLCWLRTGGIQGRVLNQVGLKPITNPEPIVTLHAYQPNPSAPTGPILYAQRCLKDGTFVINGLPPAIYEMMATRPGFKLDHTNQNYQWVHGGLTSRVRDFTISEAQPGAIQGTVTSLATGDPIANVTVTAVSATDPLGATPVPPVTTGADGTYVIPSVVVDDYDVTADGSTATPPYGSDTKTVSVIPGGSVTQDFQLPAADGTLEVTAKDASTKALLKDVTIEAVLNKVVVGTSTTDAQGVATVKIPPGVYDVVADKPGYLQATVSATVLSAQTTKILVEMDALPAGSVAGQIYRSSAPDEALGSVTVQVIVGGAIVSQTTTTPDWTYPGGGNPRYNYYIASVPSGGRVTVRASKSGFTVDPVDRTVVVNPGAVTYNVNFTVSALHTFPAGLQFFSVPFDYSTVDPSVALGTPAGQQLKMAAWDPSLGDYRMYPRAPADRLRLGAAYWMNQSQAQDLVSEGGRATSPYRIPLGVGWNGIGCPFTSAVDFYSLKVQDSLGVVRSIQDAFSAGLVQNGLYAYSLGGYRRATSVAPYSGYWIYAGQPVALVVEDPTSRAATAAVAAAPEREALAKPEGGWLAPIVVRCAGMRDESNAFGVATDPEICTASKPPLPAGERFVYASFDSTDGSGPLAVDARGAGDHKWTLTVDTTAAKAPVTVTWPDLSQLPLTARPVLRDPETGTTVYMRTQRGYTYRPRGKARHTLEIEVSDTPQGLLVVAGAAATAKANGIAVSYTLSRDAHVTAEVRNLAGVLVAQPVRNQAVAAGRNLHLWNGRNADGTAVPSGTYLVTLRARSDDGQETSAVVPVNVRR